MTTWHNTWPLRTGETFQEACQLTLDPITIPWEEGTCFIAYWQQCSSIHAAHQLLMAHPDPQDTVGKRLLNGTGPDLESPWTSFP